MPIWVFMVRYEGELTCSTHLTEKGALLAAIGDVLEYLGADIGDEEDASRVYNFNGREEDNVDPPEWNPEKLRRMKPDQLGDIFNLWVEKVWDRPEYEIEIVRTKVVA